MRNNDHMQTLHGMRQFLTGALLGCAGLMATMVMAGCGADVASDQISPKSSAVTEAVPAGEGEVNNNSCETNWRIDTCNGSHGGRPPFEFHCWHTGSYQSCCESYSSGCGQTCLSKCMSVCGYSRSTCEDSNHCAFFDHPTGQCIYPKD